MSTQLLVNVFLVGPLTAGQSVTVPHGLRSNDRPVQPKLIQPDRATPIIVEWSSVTDTEVTFTNTGSAVSEAVFRFERGLSNEVDAEYLTPLWWQGVVAGGGGGGVNAVTATAPITATGFPITDIALDTTANLSVTGGGDLDLSDTTVTAAAYGNLAAANQSIVPTFTVDAKGRLTAAASGSIQIGGSDAKTYVDNAVAAGGSTSTTIAQTYFVTTDGNDSTGDGSIAKPFATIRAALVQANTDYPATFPNIEIVVGAGSFNEGGLPLTISRHNVFVRGQSARPEDQTTKITQPITVECTSAASLNNDIVGISGCYISSASNAAAIRFSSLSGSMSLVITGVYATASFVGVSARAISIEAHRFIATNCVFTMQVAGGPSVMSFLGGTSQISDIRVPQPSAVTSGGSSVFVGSSATLFADRMLLETRNATHAIENTGTLILTNSSVTAASGWGVGNALTANSILWSVYFQIPVGQPCVKGFGAVSYGQLTFAYGYSTLLDPAVTYVPQGEAHGTVYLPSLGAGALTKNTATGAVTVVAPSTAGNVLTSNGSAWVSSPAVGAGLVPVPAGSPVLTNGAAVAISSSTGGLVLANATDLTAAPAVGLYVTGGYIRTAGDFTGLAGLVAGSSYYLDTAVAGGLTTTPPSTSGNVVQYIGRATSATSLFVSPATIVIA